MKKDNKLLIEELIDDDIRKWKRLIGFLTKIKGHGEFVRFAKKCIKRLNEMKNYGSAYYDDSYPIEKVKEKILESDKMEEL